MTRADQRQTSNRPVTDQQWTSDRRTSRHTSRRTSDGPVTGKQRTSRQTWSKQHLMQLHSRSLFFTRHRHQQSVRNRHAVISISHSHNKSRTILHTVAMSKPPLHSSSTAAICTQSAPSDHDLVLTQRGYSITSCNFTLEASSLRIIDITQAPLNHFDLVLMQGAYNNPSYDNLLVTSSPCIVDIAQAPHVCTAQPYSPLCNPSQS